MSETLVQRPTPIPNPPAREVINVDDFTLSNSHNDDDDVQFVSHFSGRRPHEPIVIDDDSDDDVEIVAGPARPAAANPRIQRPRFVRRPIRRALFSPSPPPQDNFIPPVPPLPPHARDSPPLRWRAPPDFAGLIRPLDRPLAFEAGLDAQHRLPPLRNIPGEPQVAAAEPNAVRRPNIGLGGALFAFNRRNQFGPARPALPPARAEPHGGWRNLFNNMGLGAYRMIFQRLDGSPEPLMRGGEDDAGLLEALALDAEERQQELQFRLYPRPSVDRHAPPQRRKVEPDYKPTFTHSAKPEPGFSNDFAPQESITISDGPGPSSAPAAETGTLLVCARCLDPLVTNVAGSDEEIRKRKLFALRCGHMLDGKCVDALMKPPPVLVADVGRGDECNTISSSKGKEKGNEDPSAPSGLAVGDEESEPSRIESMGHDWPPKRNKGKQRATEVEEEALYVTNRSNKRKAPSFDVSTASTAYTRSRLRPRLVDADTPAVTPDVHAPLHGISSAVDMAEGPLPVLASSDSSARRGPPRARRGRGRGGSGWARGKGRGKGKGKAAAPLIEAEYEWSCPVSSCGHKHKSVFIDGVWRMDDARGAIAMYV